MVFSMEGEPGPAATISASASATSPGPDLTPAPRRRSRPDAEARLGLSWRQLPLMSAAAQADAAALGIPGIRHLATATLDLRLSGSVGPFHLGVEGSFAEGVPSLDGDSTVRGVRIGATTALYAAGGVVAGVHGRVGALALGAEILGGVRHLKVHFDSRRARFVDAVVGRARGHGLAGAPDGVR